MIDYQTFHEIKLLQKTHGMNTWQMLLISIWMLLASQVPKNKTAGSPAVLKFQVAKCPLNYCLLTYVITA